MKKNAKKILGGVAAIICAGMGVITGISVYNSVKFSSLSKKMENLAAEKFISLEEGFDYHSGDFKNDFTAKDEISERIQDELSYKGWKLESKDSIECEAPKIIYKGNVEGTYTLNGENDEQYSYYRNEKYSLPKTNEDGTRKREYTPKTAEELEQVKLTVENAINKVLEGKVSPVRFRKSGRFSKNENENLSENKKSEYTDIQVSITSEPDFDKFIPRDYRFYRDGFGENRFEALFYAMILCFYIICMISFFLSSKTKKSYRTKRIFAVFALAGLLIFAKFDFKVASGLFLAFLALVVLLHWSLKILTRNNFSRRTYFAILGAVTAVTFEFFGFHAFSGYYYMRMFENQANFAILAFIFVSTIITFIMLAQSWRVILDERPIERPQDLQEGLNGLGEGMLSES